MRERNKLRYFLWIIIAILSAFVSCRHVDVREKAVTIPGHEWQRNYKAVVDLDVADSGSYFVHIIIRHSEKFQFTQLPVLLSVQDTAKNAIPLIKMHITVPLVDKNGNWTGENMDDLYFHTAKINMPVLLNRNRYRFILQHEMKESPLLHIFNAGIAITKITTTE